MKKNLRILQKTYKLWPILTFLLITLFVFRKVVFNNCMSIPVTDDGYHMFYAGSYYFVWAIKRWVFPFWNFMILCGHSFGINPPSHINILNFLAVFLGPKIAWSIRHMLCVFLAGYFIYLYARLIKISKLSSFICGLSYMFTNTVMIGHIHSVSFFIPLIFICLEKAIRNNRYMWISFAGIFAALYYFNGNPQFALYVFMFSCCYFIYRDYCIRGKFDIFAILKFLIFFGILTFAFSSIQVLNMFEAAKDSQRTVSFHIQSYATMLPTHLITTIFPNFFESPFRPNELNFFFGRSWIEVVKKIPAILGVPNLSYAPYVGILPLIFGILAFLKRRRRSMESFFGWFAIFTLIFMSTSFLWHLIIRHISLLNQMHQLQRIFIIYEFSLPILAGMGLDILLNADNRRVWHKIIKVTSKIFLYITGIIAVIFVFIHFFVIYNKNLFFETGMGLINKYIVNNQVYTAPIQLYELRLREFYQFLCSWTNVLASSFSISAIMIILSVSILYLYRKNTLSKNLFCFAISFLILGDLFFIVTPRLDFTPAKEVAPAFGAAEFLKTEPGIFRVFRLQDIRDQLKPMDPGSFLRPNTNLFYNISVIEGWQSLMMRRYVEFIKLVDKNIEDTGFIAEFQNFDQRIIGLMNIKYIVASHNRDVDKELRLVFEDSEYRVYENIKVLPRAFMVYKARVINDEKQILSTLKDPSFKLDEEIIIEEKVDIKLDKIPNGFSKTNPEILEYGPHIVSIVVNTPIEGYLFLSDCYAPGWEVYVDGKRDKLFKANYIFRAVRLSQGNHTIEFIYRPFSVKLGISLAFIGIVITLITVLNRKRSK